MSDLRRAVEADTAAFTPERVPAFDAVVARKRRRDRRAKAGGALAVTALAGMAVVLVPLSLGAEDRLPATSQPPVGSDVEAALYDLRFADEAAYDAHLRTVSDCLQADGVQPATQLGYGMPPVLSGRVIGAQQADGLRACVAGLEGVQITLQPAGPPLAERSLAALRPIPEAYDLIDVTTQAGVLRGDRASECLWLETDDEEPVPLLVRVGEGIHIDFSLSPFEITDGRGYSVSEGAAVRLVGDYQPEENGIPGCPVQGAPFVGGFLVESEFATEPVQDGFRDTGAGYTEKSGDSPSRMVGSFENVGAAAQKATFVVVLKEDDGTVVWTGRAAVEDIAAGETFLARYESPEPLPGGSHYVQWRVEDVVRSSAD